MSNIAFAIIGSVPFLGLVVLMVKLPFKYATLMVQSLLIASAILYLIASLAGVR